MIGLLIGANVVFLLSLAAHYTLLEDLRKLREENARLRNAELDRLLAKVAVESLEGHIGVFGKQVVIIANAAGSEELMTDIPHDYPMGDSAASHEGVGCIEPHPKDDEVLTLTRRQETVHEPHHAHNSTASLGLIRQHLPKGQSMAHLTQHDCNRILARLNTRPSKRLGYRTPKECY